MTSIGVKELAENLDEVLAKLEQGEEFSVQRDGREIAKFLPNQPQSRQSATEAISEIIKLQQGTTLGERSVQEMKHEGHKY